MKFLIWSNEHGAWWKPYELGYTKNKSEAGEYDIERAVEICLNANCWRVGIPPDETMGERRARCSSVRGGHVSNGDTSTFRAPTVAGFEEKTFERALRRVHWQQMNDVRALACVMALSVPPRMQPVQFTNQCLVPIGSFN